MPHNLSRVILIAVLSVALARPARAETLETAEKQLIAGIVVVSIGIGALVTYVVIHQKHKKNNLTGCVTSATDGLHVLDEKNKRTYTLAGDPVGVNAGHRMTFEGKRKGSANQAVFEARSVIKDLGVCPP